MGIPVLHCFVEDGTNLRVCMNLCVEAIDKVRNLSFGDVPFSVHG